MTLPVSGQLALSEIQTELFGFSGSQLNIDNQSFRLLASLANNDSVEPPQSQIRWSDVYGKGVKRITNTITRTNYNLYADAIGTGYSAGFTLVIFTNSGTLGGTSASNYALTVPTSPSGFASGDKVQVVNSGTIVGFGGQGGSGGGAINGVSSGCSITNSSFPGSPGLSGGPAIRVTFNKTFFFNSAGIIGGGGTGGAGGSGNGDAARGGGGGGGGAGYNSSGGSGGAAVLRIRDAFGTCSDAPGTNGSAGFGGTLTNPGAGGSGANFGLTGSGLGDASALVGKANVNQGAGITDGQVYGNQSL